MAGRYRIDIKKEHKYMLAASGGAELGPADATDCEMELWRINQTLADALEAAESWICNTPGITGYMTAQKFKVAEQIRDALKQSGRNK